MNQDTAGTVTSTLPFHPMVIGGQRVPAASGRQYETVDPFRGQPWAIAADGGAEDVDRAVAAARAGLDGPWGALTGFGRAKLMRKIGDLIARDADYLAELETRDTGLSGIGRENGIDAVREYTQTKAIWVELTGGTRDPFTLG